MEDTRPLRSRIYSILNKCNADEVRQVLEFCKKLKPEVMPGSSTRVGFAKSEGSGQGAEQIIDVEIDYLCGKWMHYVGQVAQWTFDMYFKGKRPEGYDKVLASTKVCYAAMLPIRLVAVNNSEVVGSISIVKHEQDDKNLTPLLTFLCVDKNKKSNAEEKLIRQSVRVLRGLGYKEAYMKVENKTKFPEDMAWEPVSGLQDVYKHTF